ncbi:MAG: hypothetical protein K2P74_03525 [Nitrosomonas sp.]|nr:hypothetical protein [Nitrosomonas sp.]
MTEKFLTSYQPTMQQQTNSSSKLRDYQVQVALDNSGKAVLDKLFKTFIHKFKTSLRYSGTKDNLTINHENS